MRGDLGIGLAAIGLAQQAQRFLAVAQAVLDPAKAVGDRRLAGAEFQCLLDQGPGLRQAHVALGQRVAECVVRLLVIGLDLDHTAQQPLHVGQAIELLGHHRLLVHQVDVVWELLVSLRQHIVRVAPQLRVAQDLRLRQHLGARVVGRLLGQAADQLAGLRDLALARQQRSAPRLHLEGALRVVDLRQPGLGRLEVALLVGGLRQQQVAARQCVFLGGRRSVLFVTGSGGRGDGGKLRRLHQLDVLLQRLGRRNGFTQLQVQGAKCQPRLRQCRRVLRQRLELPGRVAQAL